MKKSITSTFILSIAISILLLTNVHAAVIDSINEDMDTQIITLKGSGLSPNDKVLIEIFNYTNEIVDYEFGLEGIVAVNSDDNGNYEKSFRLSKIADTGNKLVRVKPAVGLLQEKQFDFFSTKSIDSIVQNWNNAIINQDKLSMENVLNDLTALKIILKSPLVSDIQNELLNENKDILTSKFLQLNTVSKIADFSEDFIKPYINFALNRLSEESFANLLFEYYNKVDTCPGDVYNNIILKMSDDEKISLFKYVASKRTSQMSDEALVNLVYKCAVFKKFNSISYYTEVKPFIDEYNDDYFKIDLENYNKIVNTYNVDSKVLNNKNEYSNFAEFKKKYEGWINDEYDNENKSKADKKLSSSGSSGSGTKATIVPFTPSLIDDDISIVEETIFDDLDGFEWAKKHIMALYNKGVVDGEKKKIFNPSSFVTREQFVKMLSGICKMPDKFTKSGFSDVLENEWYEKYISGAKEIGLVAGRSDNTFGVGENITRQDAALMCFNAIKLENPTIIENFVPKKLGFKDSNDISGYAIFAVSALNKLGVLSGEIDNNLYPLANTSRAEAAVMIDKILNLID